MTVKTLADISGDNAAHQLSTGGEQARWLKFSAVGGTARVGDSNVGSARGASVAQNGNIELPAMVNPFETYSLSQIYAYVPSGTTLSITYGGV